MTDVSVKPKRTFWHDELKTKRSPAFDVEVGVAHELRELGLVEIEGAPMAAEIAEAEVKEEAVVELVTAPKKKGKANAVDKDS